MTYKFQNVTFATSETFGMANVQIQSISFYQSRREKRILQIIKVFYVMG